MTDLTLVIDEQMLDEVKRVAARRQTTVQALVQDHLKRVAEDERVSDTRQRLVELMENQTGRLGPDHRWDRKALYAERVFPRHERARLRRVREGG